MCPGNCVTKFSMLLEESSRTDCCFPLAETLKRPVSTSKWQRYIRGSGTPTVSVLPREATTLRPSNKHDNNIPNGPCHQPQVAKKSATKRTVLCRPGWRPNKSRTFSALSTPLSN
ncbi:hypothetical protein PMAA_051860 [Talaromyces marneffei ATCC 18224]|uniref:Uncharacterized protein n=1 Tax=Talaromyces marneffei (strain ATCC 18224 / CBS 334.59 / QM 7333) TaxID=441960 RepID=B6QN36_TALMQ|nr:hypothetical protein PMAA_051860 [Talaromyces marneffei ATCC 18224]